jgi:histone H3/H4
MSKHKNFIRHRPMHQMVREATGKRIHHEATEKIIEKLEKDAVELAEKAAELCDYAERKTLMEKDVNQALREIEMRAI